MNQIDCFTTNVSVQESKPFVSKDKRTVYQFPFSKWYSINNPVVMQADPFLFVKGGTLYLFYEAMNLIGCGDIMMIFTEDLVNWSEPVVVIEDKDCHFSYPFVFEEDGTVFMMPETGCEHQIRLYKAADEELTKFELYKVILEREEKQSQAMIFDYADSSLYKKNGVFYLFTSYYKESTYYLELYTSDRFDGGFELHPMSPVCVGNKYARCGGSLIEAGGRLYRPAQDCESQYGGQLHLLEIDMLSPQEYLEHVAGENVLPQETAIYNGGGHHLNYAEFKGKTVVATDFKHRCGFFLEKIRLRVAGLLNK